MPDVKNENVLRLLVDRVDDAVEMRLVAVEELAQTPIFRSRRAAFWIVIETQD
ncbi:hypothetical protein [Granulicella sibirica]|uniref:Uncharacterized protein n=1 Tax=Granulicella sibirica TaxID=2479048 RepID=A0A4Q0T1U6_9BACT|nr:hypothetical protein [Granulicella sibirica]RXH57147.1 hypothetical protein GRAN_0457 [Granulicella sibirica]